MSPSIESGNDGPEDLEVSAPSRRVSFWSVLQEDYRRPANAGGLVRITLFVFRAGQYARGPMRILWKLADQFVLRVLIGAELPPTVRCGPGLALPHAGRGVVVHPASVIGDNSMLFHRVTLAATSHGAPCLQDNVLVGTGAVVLGPVVIGSGAVIGANAVVTHDIPAGATAAGVPARVISGPTA